MIGMNDETYQLELTRAEVVILAASLMVMESMAESEKPESVNTLMSKLDTLLGITEDNE